MPQPKVYETLRRLKERGAVVQISGHPVRWSAVPPNTLLDNLDQEFGGRLDAAREGLADVTADGAEEGDPHVVWHHSDKDAILASARRILAAAVTHVYLSGSGAGLAEIADEVAAAAGRGVEFTLLHFGELPFPAPRGRPARG